jgi:hypothetical protein
MTDARGQTELMTADDVRAIVLVVHVAAGIIALAFGDEPAGA